MATTVIREQVAAEVRAEMARQRIRQADLAKALGRNQAWVSIRLTGEVPFTVDDLNDVCRALGVRIIDLFGRMEEINLTALERRGLAKRKNVCSPVGAIPTLDVLDLAAA